MADFSRIALGILTAETLRDFPDYSEECQQICSNVLVSMRKNNEPLNFHGHAVPITCGDDEIIYTVGLVFNTYRGGN